MSLRAAVGHSSAIEGREASAEAVRTALQLAAGEKAALAFILASGDYPFQEVLNGVTPMLGDMPTIGFSTSHELTPNGSQSAVGNCCVVDWGVAAGPDSVAARLL